MLKAVVPDTNFWLHAELPFKFLDVIGTADLVVVVPQVVLAELDRHQHEGRRHVKTRARERVMAFRKLMNGGVRRPFGIEVADAAGVTYWLVATPQTAAGSADDRIVATAMQISGEAEIAILTADASMQMTAHLAGIEVIEVPPEMLKPSDADPLEQEVAQLKRAVEKLRSPQSLDVLVKAEQLWPLEAPATLHRLELPTDEQLAAIRQGVLDGMTYRRLGRRLSLELEQYHSELPAYADAVVAYLANLARYNTLAEAAMEVQLLLTNRTGQPVADAVLEIKAPAGVVFTYPQPPVAPKPPSRPPTADELIQSKPLFGSVLGSFSPYKLPRNLQFLSNIDPRIHMEERFAEVKFGEPLRPDHEAFGGRFWVALAADYPDDSIRLSYVLYAAIASRPVRGDIIIPVSHHREPWTQPVLPTYLQPSLKARPLATQVERKTLAEERSGRP